MYEFILPDLGEGIHEGEILKWYVEPGQVIKEDEPLVDIETDKAAVTIPSPRGGKMVSQSGNVGDTVFVGNVIAVIDAEGETAASAAPAKPPKPAAEAGKAAAPREPAPPAPPAQKAEPAAPAPAAAAKESGPVPAAPATRRLARELGVDIRLVPPSGPGGRVTSDDVKRFADGDAPGAPAAPSTETTADRMPSEKAAVAEFAAHAASTIPFLDIEPLPDFSQWGPVEIEPLRSIRRKVAHKMVTSMTLVPHVAHMDEADVTLLDEFRKREKERRSGQAGSHLTLLAFVVKAVTAGLKAAPAFNASLDPFKEQIIFKNYYHIGIAADTGRGLVVPVIKDTDRKSIIQIATEIGDVATRAREGQLELSELRGGTFTITNVGPLGGTALIPMINYPEVAILGMGKVQEKPVVREGAIVIRKILPLTLAFDHRIADGADAARFVSELVRQLSDPNLLLLEA
ncbi:MAG: dihydrolipoamide acetyltransferase family protein [Planctomycetota bacterium]